MLSKIIKTLSADGIIPAITKLTNGATTIAYERAGKQFFQKYNKFEQLENFTIGNLLTGKATTGSITRSYTNGQFVTNLSRVEESALGTNLTNMSHTHLPDGHNIEISHSMPRYGVKNVQIQTTTANNGTINGQITKMKDNGQYELEFIERNPNEVKATVVSDEVEVLAVEPEYVNLDRTLSNTGIQRKTRGYDYLQEDQNQFLLRQQQELDYATMQAQNDDLAALGILEMLGNVM